MLAWDETAPLPLLRWHGPPGVVAAFSCREGGVSEPPFATLNLGLSAGDTRARVAVNRHRLCAAVGADPARTSACHQIHSAIVHVAEPLPGGFCTPTAAAPRGDGLVTRTEALALVAFAADCVPVVIARRDGTAVAVCHAGWRGLLGGVVEATAAALGDGALAAAVGPCAGPAAYAVGPDVAGPLTARFGAGVVRDGRADLPACAVAALATAGVGRPDVAGVCTIGDARFFSHRRDGAPGGRQALIAYLAAAAA